VIANSGATWFGLALAIMSVACASASDGTFRNNHVTVFLPAADSSTGPHRRLNTYAYRDAFKQEGGADDWKGYYAPQPGVGFERSILGDLLRIGVAATRYEADFAGPSFNVTSRNQYYLGYLKLGLPYGMNVANTTTYVPSGRKVGVARFSWAGEGAYFDSRFCSVAAGVVHHRAAYEMERIEPYYTNVTVGSPGLLAPRTGVGFYLAINVIELAWKPKALPVAFSLDWRMELMTAAPPPRDYELIGSTTTYFFPFRLGVSF
jgi:hypothetical protein